MTTNRLLHAQTMETLGVSYIHAMVFLAATAFLHEKAV